MLGLELGMGARARQGDYGVQHRSYSQGRRKRTEKAIEMEGLKIKPDSEKEAKKKKKEMETNRKTAREKHMHIETEMISERERVRAITGRKCPAPPSPQHLFHLASSSLSYLTNRRGCQSKNCMSQNALWMGGSGRRF